MHSTYSTAHMRRGWSTFRIKWKKWRRGSGLERLWRSQGKTERNSDKKSLSKGLSLRRQEWEVTNLFSRVRTKTETKTMKTSYPKLMNFGTISQPVGKARKLRKCLKRRELWWTKGTIQSCKHNLLWRNKCRLRNQNCRRWILSKPKQTSKVETRATKTQPENIKTPSLRSQVMQPTLKNNHQIHRAQETMKCWSRVSTMI